MKGYPSDCAEPPFDGTALDFENLRMRNRDRLRSEMRRADVDAMWLLSPGSIRYIAGSALLPSDAGRGVHQRASALLTSDGDLHLFTPHPEIAPSEIPADNVQPCLDFETQHGIDRALHEVAERLPGWPDLTLALDETSAALFFALQKRPQLRIANALASLAAAKIIKGKEELECIRRAQRINEFAMRRVRDALRPGLRQCDLTALFFSEIYALGASANGIDPIWQIMPPSRALGPFTPHGDVAFPTCTTDRIIQQGDVLWVDTGIEYGGYQSDFGRTFLAGATPDARKRDQGRCWLEVVEAVLEAVRPGVTGLELGRVARKAAGGTTPWLDHFYLIHGVGTEAAEPPFIGSDLGEAHDASLELAPGMTLVLEPVIWDEGHAGYRAEDIVAVTDDGYERLSDFPYAPYDESVKS